MITFEDAFAQLHAIRPYMSLAPNLAWVSALSWADEEAIIYFTMTVLERQKFAAARDLGWLEEISIAAVNDINALLREATERGEPEEGFTRRSLLFLRFLFSIVPMETAQGLVGDTLREHERLQYLVATIDTLERWRAERANVFSEIESLNERSVAASEVGSSALFARDARIGDVAKRSVREFENGRQDGAEALRARVHNDRRGQQIELGVPVVGRPVQLCIRGITMRVQPRRPRRIGIDDLIVPCRFQMPVGIEECEPFRDALGIDKYGGLLRIRRPFVFVLFELNTGLVARKDRARPIAQGWIFVRKEGPCQ